VPSTYWAKLAGAGIDWPDVVRRLRNATMYLVSLVRLAVRAHVPFRDDVIAGQCLRSIESGHVDEDGGARTEAVEIVVGRCTYRQPDLVRRHGTGWDRHPEAGNGAAVRCRPPVIGKRKEAVSGAEVAMVPRT